MSHRLLLQPVTKVSIIQLCQEAICSEVLAISVLHLHNFEENYCDETVYVYRMYWNGRCVPVHFMK